MLSIKTWFQAKFKCANILSNSKPQKMKNKKNGLVPLALVGFLSYNTGSYGAVILEPTIPIQFFTSIFCIQDAPQKWEEKQKENGHAPLSTCRILSSVT